MHTRFGLALLMLAGCPGDDASTEVGDDDGSTGAATTRTDTGAPTSATPSTSTPTSTAGTDATQGPTDPSTTGPATSPSGGTAATSTTATRTDTSSSSGTAVHPCTAACQVEVDCGHCGTKWEDVEACEAWCLGNLEKAGQFSLACRYAWRNLHECVGGLECKAFTSWCAKDPPFEYPCVSADEELSFECEGQ